MTTNWVLISMRNSVIPGLSVGLYCWQVGCSEAAVVRLVSGSRHSCCGAHTQTLSLTPQPFHFCVPCVNSGMTNDEGWLTLTSRVIVANCFLSTFSSVDAFWWALICNTHFALHIRFHMSIHMFPLQTSSSLIFQWDDCLSQSLSYTSCQALFCSSFYSELAGFHVTRSIGWNIVPLLGIDLVASRTQSSPGVVLLCLQQEI